MILRAAAFLPQGTALASPRRLQLFTPSLYVLTRQFFVSKTPNEATALWAED